MVLAPSPMRQQSFDDLGTPLAHVTFCVIDLETTGGSPASCEITEIAAARYVGGECTGVLATLVNPGVPIPPTITYLTGITESMVGPAPRIDAVLPALLEFVGDAVIVGHNVRFDLGFLNTALSRRGYEHFSNRVVDTLRLARRLVRDEVPDCKLGTLAQYLMLDHQPCHRALDDVRATADLLHLLFERAAGLGVLGLDDLMELPTLGRHPSAAKLKLTNYLPRRPGVYLFRDAGGDVLYVGKATNLRSRVRSYFGSDDRRKVGPLLHTTARIDHMECATALEAAVLEIRLIQHHLPRYNRQSKFWTSYAYLRIGGTAGSPKLTAVRQATPGQSGWLLGPFSSIGAARVAAGAMRECVTDLPPTTILDRYVINRADVLLAPLHSRMHRLAGEDRFEEAASVRDRGGVLSRAIARQHRCDALRAVPHLEMRWQGLTIVAEHGRVVVGRQVPCGEPDQPLPRQLADEVTLLATWLDREAHRVQLIHGSPGLALPIGVVPRFHAGPMTAPRPAPARIPIPIPIPIPAYARPERPRTPAARPRGAPVRTTRNAPSPAMRLFGVTPASRGPSRGR